MGHRSASSHPGTATRAVWQATAAILLAASPIAGQEAESGAPPARRFRVVPATSEIRIDAVLDDAAWSAAEPFDLPYEWLPGDNTPPPVETECRVAYDADNLYIGCRAFDPDPSAIRAHVTDRDDMEQIPRDDQIGFLLDTFNDQRRAFQFRVTALGVQADAIISSSRGFEDFSWDAIWSSAGRITEDGYVVELALPLRALRFSRVAGEQTWGFIAFRDYPRSVRHRIRSSFTDRDNQCLLCQTDKLEGLADIAPGRNIEFDPTLTASRTDMRSDFPAGAMSAGDVEVEPGITALWGMTPSLTLSVALNPDFSQVEADAAQLEVNRRFALRYEEKRPFFLENADYFETPIEAVFTRTVADPLGGLKFTGKVGANAVGVFFTQDRVNNFIIPGNQRSQQFSLEDDVTGGVLRYRRDVGESSTLGALATAREATDYYNRVGGLDAFWQISESNNLSVQYLYSSTRYPAEVAEAAGQSNERIEGDGLVVNLAHESRNWAAELGYAQGDPDFRVDFGFEPRVDLREVEAELVRVFWGRPGGWFTQFAVGTDFDGTWDYDGLLTDQMIALFLDYEGPLQSEASLELSSQKEYFEGETYDLFDVEAAFELRPSGSLSLGLFAEVGEGIDYENSRKADELELASVASVSLGRHLRVDLEYDLSRFSLGGEEIFSESLLQTRLLYHFSVRSFVRLILQYRAVSQNPEMYSEPVAEKEEGLFSQFLFSYKLNPRTVLFVGYSDNYLGDDDVPLTQLGRTFFMKLGYALQL
jgi:hypothetical protein